MSWLTNFSKPKISTRKKRGVSASVWAKCPACGDLIYDQDLVPNLYVCGACGHHLRWPLKERLAAWFDKGLYTEIPVPHMPDDPLQFKDRKRYKDRLKEARKATGREDAFVVASGEVGGNPCVVVALDFDFMAGSMSRAVGEAVVVAAQAAQAAKTPLLAVTASGGARMQESVFSLMQMARTTAALADLREAGVPYIVMLADPTTGGVTASFAMLGDVTLAEPGALIGFAGPRVIAQTIGGTLPEGFQRAEYLKEHGMVDAVVARGAQKTTIARLISLLG
ncbi:MAG: acetyl-CoA carboxylase carboxyl transferase subunit beta [Alphaproteobacteria bacterium CG_4_10_14_0_8_um_filter_53_9]|nr:MAG: acetyl-CoA carboxylase carboxyl transferase subunit beta [Alphaproteobacteria bacterium CG_4_10_14_0_8_um_filter_53_9]